MNFSYKLLISITLLSNMTVLHGRAESANEMMVIPLDLSGARPAVSLAIGDSPPSLVTFDTGTMYNFIDSDSTREFGFVNEGRPPAPFAQNDAFTTTIHNARINNKPIPAFKAIVMPWNILPNRIAMIGPNIFSGSLVTLDFRAAELRITKKTTGLDRTSHAIPYGNPPYSMPNLQIKIGDRKISALLDTGSAYTILFPLADAKNLELSEPLIENGLIRGHNGQYSIFDSKIAGTVQIGPLTVENPSVRFTDAVPFANVGMEYLKKMTITLDPEAQKLWIDLPVE
jgi:hypothetical protein